MRIILASGSPRREKLLQQINLDFSVHVSDASEDYDPRDDPPEIVKKLALRKAMQVAAEYQEEPVMVIGADTIVVYENEILEKPVNAAEAHEMLQKLSNTVHQVLTGVAVVKSDKPGKKNDVLTFVECTDVTFGVLDEDKIREYVQTGDPMDKAGGYGIQDDWGSIFVRKINGDYYNVVGFPLHSFYHKLKEFAPELVPRSIKDPV